MKAKERHLPPLQNHDLRKDMPTGPSLVAWAERGWPASYPSHQISDSKNCFIYYASYSSSVRDVWQWKADYLICVIVMFTYSIH